MLKDMWRNSQGDINSDLHNHYHHDDNDLIESKAEALKGLEAFYEAHRAEGGDKLLWVALEEMQPNKTWKLVRKYP